MKANDTQAPERLDLTGHGSLITGWNHVGDAPGDHEWEGEYIRADLSAAREAAAWIAGRDAAVAYHQDIFDHDSQGIEYSSLVGIPISNLKDLEWSCRKAELDIQAISALTPPADPATALDWLIAERVREAVEAALDAVHEADSLELAMHGTTKIAERIEALVVRGSKEGRDG